MSDISPTIQPLGETALVLSVGAELAAQRRLWAAWHVLEHRLPQVEWVLGMGNLTAHFDPLATPSRVVIRALEGAWTHSAGVELMPGQIITLPVRYGGEYGPDLPVVAEHAGLTPREVAEAHAAGDYVVYCLGFLPGFAYLGGLDPRITAPRRADPRLAVPAGSVAIGGSQTGIYPMASPGGWQLIGHTGAALFDPYREIPGLLGPGDTVRFVIEDIA
ncbi:5-oxoprolinase subunit PxpB [Chitiniphilus eburneus]|uniref:5-oxoprolinase subunit PxpB n=1 Tax=Chitiniphilus eburneus TaxID=2571148 RepID=A0A4U0PRW5_9NEIS|nr:5-oxoprolinase subunit PxpB [Chitiniphilus eburneus]TJZ71029.1 5-oxoprolinase subunit PxpB [Chitiniphilus eburneus]